MKSGRRVCGTGAALANAPLVQDKSYFEVKVQCGGQSIKPLTTLLYGGHLGTLSHGPTYIVHVLYYVYLQKPFYSVMISHELRLKA